MPKIDGIDELLLEGNNNCEDWEWEDLCDQLTEAMDKLNPSGNWTAEMTGFG